MDSYVLGQDKPKYDTLTAFETEYHVVLACSMPFFFFAYLPVNNMELARSI